MAVMRDQVTVGTSASTLALTGQGRRVRVENVEGTGSITFTTDGTTAAIGTAEQYAVSKAAGANREVDVDCPVTLSLISSVAATEVYVEIVTIRDDE
jgi:hypothetical protein